MSTPVSAWGVTPDENSIQIFWDKENTSDKLYISDDGLTLAWNTDEQFAWLPSQTTARLSNGIFLLDFQIDATANRQIGVGFLVEPIDWGFFGYLGAGTNAWSYDAFEGAIVTETAAIHSGLPGIQDKGTVTLRLDLKRKNEAVFIVNSTETPAISLLPEPVVIPAGCLLKQGQKVTLANFRQVE